MATANCDASNSGWDVRSAELRDLAELRAEIDAEGLFQPTPVLALGILLFHIVVMVTGVVCCFMLPAWWAKALALAVSTYGSVGVGMTGHNASHRGVTGSPDVDRCVTFLSMTLLLGISSHHWWHKHITLHHVAPNHVGHDPDIDLLPYIALNQEEVRAAKGVSRYLRRLQPWSFPVLIGLNLLNLQQTGIRYLIGELRHAKARRGKLWIEAGCYAMHGFLVFVAPALVWSLWQVVAVFLVREVVNGYALFAAAAPAHFPAEARFITAADAKLSGFITGQTHTTVDYRTGPIGRLMCLGAEYQIEHHLLPTANPLKMWRISEIVEAFCNRHGYPYRRLAWWEGIVKSIRVAAQPKPIHRVDELRQVT